MKNEDLPTTALSVSGKRVWDTPISATLSLRTPDIQFCVVVCMLAQSDAFVNPFLKKIKKSELPH